MTTLTTGRATDFITFSRPGATGGGATVTDSDGKIKWAGHNLLLNSEQFDNATNWSKTNVTVNANAGVAPNGTTTAEQLLETTTNAGHLQGQSVATAAGRHTFAIYAKPSGRDFVGLYNGDFAVGKIFDIANGTVGSDITAAPVSASVTAVGNGWYRCEIVVDTTATTSNWRVYVCNSSSTFSYAGDITKGIYLWGAHLYRSDLGSMVLNPARGDAYYPTTVRNIYGYTEAFSDAYWSKNSATIVPNSLTAPNGLATADTLLATAGTAVRPYVAPSIHTGVLSTPLVASIYAKQGTARYLQIWNSAGATSWHVNFDLQTGTKGSESNCTGAIQSVGNGWYRCSVAYSPSLAANITTVFQIVTSSTSARAEQWDPVGTESIYLWGAQLSDSASLDAYSPVYGAAVTSAAYYAPRLDFDPVTLAARGLLVEEQRTNAITYSSDFSQWTNSGALVTTNSVVAPDGTQTADDLARDTSQADARYVTLSFTGDGSKALSFYVKYNTSPTFSAFLYDTTVPASRAEIQFTFTGGVPAATTTSTGSVEAIEAVGSGWYRIKIVATGVVAANTNRFYLYPARAGSANGDKTTFWGAQAEVQTATFSTSLIPTNGATATRTADVASVSTQAFPYSGTAGTFVVNFSSLYSTSPVGTPVQISLFPESGANGYVLYWNGSAISSFDGTNTLNATIGVTNWRGPHKVASAYGAGFKLISLNGAAPVSSNYNGAWGAATGFTTRPSGHIRQITYLPRRLSDAELQARTV